MATAIYDVERGQQELWILDTETNAPRRLTAEPGTRDAPVWSPDSTTLAFMHTADATPPRVHFRGLGQNDLEEAMPGDGFQMPADWSRDGRFLAFVNSAFARVANDQQSDVWLVDLARGRRSVPLLNTRFHESTPVFSPDGRWLAFTSNESGRPEVYVQAFRSGDDPGVFGERHLVSHSGAVALRWPGKGQELSTWLRRTGVCGFGQPVSKAGFRRRDTTVHDQHRSQSCDSFRSPASMCRPMANAL